ncbi:MAG TPA: Omp28-related outer membrane protein [Saprospiraceae bacterium]|nr:Omp28-related outer membrane protein [Saprospiraceae bacterium]
MIRGVITIFFFLFYWTGFTQSVPKYALVEHFTNTWCPICAGRNPSLFNALSNHTGRVHHVSYHPPYPYSGCPLYQFNKKDNQDRADFYQVFGTPTVVLNGGNKMGGSPLLTETVLQAELQKTSPVSVRVSESGQGQNRSATVTVKSGVAINGDLRLMVLAAEKNLQFTASNGELEHYNVMRKFLTPSTGQKLTIYSAGEQTFTFNFRDTAGWKAEEIYVLAFVQNATTREVLNSGTRFDELSTPVHSAVQPVGIKIYPTLVEREFNVDHAFTGKTDLKVYNIRGQLVLEQALAEAPYHAVSVSRLAPGAYWIKIMDGQAVYNARFIKY